MARWGHRHLPVPLTVPARGEATRLSVALCVPNTRRDLGSRGGSVGDVRACRVPESRGGCVCVCPPAGGRRALAEGPHANPNLIFPGPTPVSMETAGSRNGNQNPEMQSLELPARLPGFLLPAALGCGIGSMGVARMKGGPGSGCCCGARCGAECRRCARCPGGDVQHGVQAGWDNSCAHLHVGMLHAAAPTCAPCGCGAVRSSAVSGVLHCCSMLLAHGGDPETADTEGPLELGTKQCVQPRVTAWGAAGTASALLVGGLRAPQKAPGGASPPHHGCVVCLGSSELPGANGTAWASPRPRGCPKGWLSSAPLPVGWDGDTAQQHPPTRPRHHCVCAP